MDKVLLVFVGAVLSTVLCQNCRSDWKKIRECMQSRYDEYSSQRRLNDTGRSALEDTIRNCYLQQECQDPFPTAVYAQASRDCYLSTQASLRKDLQTCVQKLFNDFEMQDDDGLAYFWAQDEVYIKAAEDSSTICGDYINQNTLTTCVTRSIEDAFTNDNQKKQMCDVRQECSAQINDVCYTKWEEKIKPKLCTCATDLLMTQKKTDKTDIYKNQYKQCMQTKRQTVSEQDAYFKYVDNYKNRMCGSKKDPCGGLRPNGEAGTGTGTVTPGPAGRETTTAITVNNVFGNLVKLITGSGGSLTGTNKGTNTLGALTSGLGGNSQTGGGNTGLSSLFSSLTNNGNTNPLSGLLSVFQSGTKGLSDLPKFGSLKGDGGFGSILGGQGNAYDMMGKRKK